MDELESRWGWLVVRAGSGMLRATAGSSRQREPQTPGLGNQKASQFAQLFLPHGGRAGIRFGSKPCRGSWVVEQGKATAGKAG